ncbi:MAG: type II secretion system F family protein [Candidatus Xenobiia bacterium LiM19]
MYNFCEECGERLEKENQRCGKCGWMPPVSPVIMTSPAVQQASSAECDDTPASTSRSVEIVDSSVADSQSLKKDGTPGDSHCASAPVSKISSSATERKNTPEKSAIQKNRPVRVVSPVRAMPLWKKKLHIFISGGKPKGWHLAQFFRQMATLSTAGIPLERSLEICADQCSDPVVFERIESLKSDIRIGCKLSEAMGGGGSVFNSFHAESLKSSEAEGNMSRVFNNLATWEEKDYHLRQRLKSVLVYPMVICAISAVGVIFLVKFLLPLVLSVTGRSDHSIPWPTRFLIVIGKILEDPLGIVEVLSGLFCLLYILKRLFAIPAVKVAWDGFRMHLPFVGMVLRSSMLIRISRSIASLLDANIPLVTAVELSGLSCGSIYVREKIISTAIEYMRKGETLSQALIDQKIFPVSFHGMVAIGETSGRLPQILKKLADIFEIEMNVQIEIVLKALEPIIITMVGGLVLFVMLCAFLPLYDTLRGFSGF